MNDDIIDIEKEIGIILTKFKHIEYILNCIITNFLQLKDKKYTFFENVILNSQVMSTGNKIKVIKTICKNKGNKYDFNKLHKLLDLRNLFAHENYYMESSKDGYLITIDVLKSNGRYEIASIKSKFEEFKKLYDEVLNELNNLNNSLSNN